MVSFLTEDLRLKDADVKKVIDWSHGTQLQYSQPTLQRVDAMAMRFVSTILMSGVHRFDERITLQSDKCLIVTLQAIKNFPEVFGLDVESQMKANVEKLKKDWKMTDKVIPNVVKRQPQVLGYNVDCEGNCMGECNRCWIRL